MEELKKKFAELIKKYGNDNRLYTFEICGDYGHELEGSTIDAITIEGNDIIFYYNENTGDYDNITAFKPENLEKWYKAVKLELDLDGLQYDLVDENIDDAEEIMAKYGDVRFVDEKIDDGCDDGEDDYVMMRSYNVGEYYVRIYYGNNTGIIGYIDAE